VGYLTIQESLTTAGESQRRSGLHIEAPGVVMSSSGTIKSQMESWGKGGKEHTFIGGVYMASTVAKSTKIWNAQIRYKIEVVGEMGDIEHLREFLDEEDSNTLEAGELVWFTDTTPHEALPLEKGTYRQYFRFVTSGLSVWFDHHNTKNRLGVVPDPRWTEIITGDKFSTRPCMHCKPAWAGWWCSYCGNKDKD